MAGKTIVIPEQVQQLQRKLYRKVRIDTNAGEMRNWKVNNLGKPYAGKPHVRFDERGSNGDKDGMRRIRHVRGNPDTCGNRNLYLSKWLPLLYLDSNQIGAAGSQVLGTALQVNQTLQALGLFENQIGNTDAQALIAALQINHTLQLLNVEVSQIDDAGTKKQVYALPQANKQIAIRFQRQIKEVQKFLQSHENNEGILLQNLPQLQELLQKWHTDSKNIISSLEKILIESGRTNLNDRYRKKLEEIITDLTNRLHNLWLESFERKVVALSNKYVMGKDASEERNVDLGYALYETWLTFLDSDCPNWVEDHIQSLIPFGVLLDIAQGGKKKDVIDLTNAHLLFERVLSFKNKSKDSLFSLTNQSQKS